MNIDYKNTTVCVFNSYKNAIGFSKQVNGKITVTKQGKFKVRYIHSERQNENFTFTDLSKLIPGSKVRLIRQFGFHKRIKEGDFFLVLNVFLFDESKYNYAVIKHIEKGYTSKILISNKRKMYATNK